MFYDIRGISRCLHKCHLLLGNLPNLHNPLVLLKEKSSDETSSLHWLSYQKKEKKTQKLPYGILVMQVAKPGLWLALEATVPWAPCPGTATSALHSHSASGPHPLHPEQPQ